MAIIDTTDVIGSAMAQKANLQKNLTKENYYLKSLQDKVNREWNYRYNVVDIEEEKEKQKEYTSQYPIYSPIEAVIQRVITDKGEKLSDDWKRIVFRDIKHPVFLGQRFRFAYDFEKFVEMTEEEKRVEASVWIAANFDTTAPTKGIVIRRCNTNIAFGGSPNRNHKNITEVHYEPCILESDLKYINTYFNKVLNISQAEIYAIMQYNFFTQNILVNDRYIIGDTDLEVRDNNTAFKVKAVTKFFGDTTFKVNSNEELADIPFVVVALDRDTLAVNDDFERRLAERCTLYKTGQEVITSGYNIKFEEPVETTILLGEQATYKCNLYEGETLMESETLSITTDLEGTDDPEMYFGVRQKGNNEIVITNRKTYTKGKLKITATWGENSNVVEVELGGWY